MKNNKLKSVAGITIAVLAILWIAYEGFLTGGSKTGKKEPPSESYTIFARSIEELGPGYSITGSYPEISGTVEDADAFNRDISSAVQAKEDGFKQTFSTWDTSLLPPEIKNATSTLIIGYTLSSTSTNLVSVLFYSETYLVGMAHPSHAMESVNFDLTTGRDIALGDLFKPGADYLEDVADYAMNDITNQIKNGTYSSTPEYLSQNGGLLPDPANFQVFNITPNALVIHFEEYQVGPYASGPAMTTIPWNALSSVLNPRGPLSHLF